MTRRRTLSDIGVSALKPRASRYTVPDPELRGHYVRVTPNGSKSFVSVARDPEGKQVWTTIGATDALSIEASRDKARRVLTRVRGGLPPIEPTPEKPDSFREVAETYLKRHVRAQGLRTEYEIERCLRKYVLPEWQDREFVSIKRSDVAALLDRVQDRNGARQADYCLALVRGISNWFASRHDDYVSPFTRGMRRTDPKTRKRARILDDYELRAIWLANRSGAFS